MSEKTIIKLELYLNMLGVLSIFFISAIALAYQFWLNELPCPLCLLQRIGFLGVAFGYLRNLRFGLKPSNYAISLFSALFTSWVALRQIALHIVPGTGAYGDAFLGFHFYTWSFIVAMVIVVVTILMMSVDRQFHPAQQNKFKYPMCTYTLFVLMAIIFIINIISVIGICSFGFCPDNPTHYYWPKF